MRPTQTRVFIMAIIKKGDGIKFINAGNAVMALQTAQFYFSMLGYLTSSHIDIENKYINLTVHFTDKSYPKLPHGYLFSSIELSSHWYFSERENKADKVRVVSYQYYY